MNSPPLSGKATSVWMDTAPHTTYPALTEALTVDVCVIGGGICGLTTAVALKEAGATVALIDSHRVGAGVSGYTTAKVSALQGLIYDEVSSKHGADGARVYAEANVAGLEWIADRVERDGIDCDFRRKPAFTYAEDVADLSDVEKEVEAAREAGLAAEFTTDSDLPWEVSGAIRLDNQAEFHARKYMLALAGAIGGGGSHVLERTRALGVSGTVVKTDQGDIEAGHVIVATHYPFLDRGLFFARLSPSVPTRSGCMSAARSRRGCISPPRARRTPSALPPTRVASC